MKRLLVFLTFVCGLTFFALTSCTKTYTLSALTAPPPTPIFTSTPTSVGVMVTTVAGTGTAGSGNGTGTAASFNGPVGIAVDASGNLYIGDFYNNLVRKISSGAMVSTLAGSGSIGSTNATGTAASFWGPAGVAVDSSGNVYVADYFNYLIRKITSGGVVTTLAGSGSAGSTNGTGTTASFDADFGVAVDLAGNVFVADSSNNMIRKITPGGVVSTFAGSGAAGAIDATGTSATFWGPIGVAVDSSGNLYVADYINNLIRKITSAGVVTTLAGSGSAGSANGTGTAASFNGPIGIAVDSSGNVYVGDQMNNKIRKITPGGLVTTYAGSGVSGYADGPAATAKFDSPNGVAVDSFGAVFVGDNYNSRVRKIQ